MKECENFQTIIQDYVAGEIPPSRLESLRQHCSSCLDCRALLDLHIEISELGQDVPEPEEASFEAMRSQVMAQISQRAQSSRTAQSGQTALSDQPARRRWNWGALFGLRPALALPAVAVLLIAAVFVGRWTATPSDNAVPYQPVPYSDSILMTAVAQQASTQSGLDGYWDTPFSYTNVSVKPVAGGKLDLSFDVCRHINMVTPANSPVAKDVLLQAILSQAPLGARMKAMEMAPATMDPKLEEALVYTMHNDPELAVRLEALSVLTRFPYNDGVQSALMTTLRQDQSVQMRLLALERLADKQVQMETLQQVIGDANMESDPVVMQHAIKLMNGAIDEQQ
jgi:hypothetical protein